MDIQLQNEIMTKEHTDYFMRRIFEVQQSYVGNHATPRIAASEDVIIVDNVKINGRTPEGAELSSLCAKSRNYYYVTLPKQTAAEIENTDDDEDAPELPSIMYLYRSWCKSNDHIPSDIELAHFLGKINTGGFARARSRMKLEHGYEFARDEIGIGWYVSKRPAIKEIDTQSEKKYTELDMLAKFAEFLKAQK